MVSFTLSQSQLGEQNLPSSQLIEKTTAAIACGVEDNKYTLWHQSLAGWVNLESSSHALVTSPPPCLSQQLELPTTDISFNQLAPLLQLRIAANLLAEGSKLNAAAPPRSHVAAATAPSFPLLTSFSDSPSYTTSGSCCASNLHTGSGIDSFGPLQSSAQNLFMTNAEAAFSTMSTAFKLCPSNPAADRFASHQASSLEPVTPSTFGGPSLSSRSPSTGSEELQSGPMSTTIPVWPPPPAGPAANLPSALTDLLVQYMQCSSADGATHTSLPPPQFNHLPNTGVPATMNLASLQQVLTNMATDSAANAATADETSEKRVRRRRRRNNGSRVTISEGLPRYVTRTQIAMLLARYGRVRDIQITGSRAASARLPSAAIAETAVRELNGSVLFPDHGPLQLRTGKRVTEPVSPQYSAAAETATKLPEDVLPFVLPNEGDEPNDNEGESGPKLPHTCPHWRSNGSFSAAMARVIPSDYSELPPDVNILNRAVLSSAGAPVSDDAPTNNSFGINASIQGRPFKEVFAMSLNNSAGSCGSPLSSTLATGGEATGPPGANLFVFHIPGHWTEMELTDTFARFGRIVQARIATDRVTRRRLGFGFVSFSNTHDAAAAVRVMNGARVGGKWLKVTVKRGEETNATAVSPAHIRSIPTHDILLRGKQMR